MWERKIITMDQSHHHHHQSLENQQYKRTQQYVLEPTFFPEISKLAITEFEDNDKNTKPRRYGPKVKINCSTCNKEFEVWPSKINWAKKKYTGNVYCSKECYMKNRKSFYEKFYYCNNCNKGIPKEDAVKRGTRLCCPKRDCNYNRLKTENTRYRYRNGNGKEKKYY